MQCLIQYLSYYIQTWHDGRRMDALYAHGRFDDLGLDASSQWVDKGKNQRCIMLSAIKQAICTKVAATVGQLFCVLDLDFANVYKACPSCFLVGHGVVIA